MRAVLRPLALVALAGCGGPAPAIDAGVDAGVVCRAPAEPKGPWLTEVTDAIGLGRTADLEPVATEIVAGDLDGDGWEDLIAAVFDAAREPAGGARTRFVFFNRPDPSAPGGRRFVDDGGASGLFATRDGAGGRGATVFSLADLDGDLDLDVIGCPGSGDLVAVVDPCAAFLNDGTGTFALAPEAGDLESEVYWVPSSATLDYDEDGVLDFWPGTVGEWAYGPARTSRPRLYRGRGDGTFEEVGADVGLPTDLAAPGDYRINFGVTSCDLDQDGDRDMLLANYFVMPNYVFEQRGGSFVDVAAEIGAQRTGVGGHTLSMTCGDLDDDGDNDLALAEISHPGSGTDYTALLVNGAPAGTPLQRFSLADEWALGFGRAPGLMEGDNVVFFVDLDLDGRKDLAVASSNYPQQDTSDPEWTHTWIWRQLAGGTFEDVTPRTPFGDPAHQSLEGGVWVDYDHDGDLDFIIGTGTINGERIGLTRRAIRAYRNEIGQSSNWIQLRLVGSGAAAGGASTSAIGARVTLVSGGRAQHQEVLGSWGHSNTQNDVLTFGLGAECAIDRIEVIWPDRGDTTTVYTNVLPNRRAELRQGEAEPRYLDMP
jgi:hypothetical protein